MAETALYRYYNQIEAAFIKHFRKTSQKLKPERIHKLRVDIKRIRAIFKLLDFSCKEEFDKTEQLEALSQLFKVAGRLREVQVNLMQIGDPSHPETKLYMQYLEGKEKKALIRFEKKMKAFNLEHYIKRNKPVKKLIEDFNDEKVMTKSKEFLENEIKEIIKLQSDLFNEKRLHKIRIHLKSMEAITKLLADIIPGDEFKNLSGSIQSLGLMVGDWHDKQMLIRSIKKYVRKNKGGAEAKKIMHLKEKIEKECAEMECVFEQQLNKLVHGIPNGRFKLN